MIIIKEYKEYIRSSQLLMVIKQIAGSPGHWILICNNNDTILSWFCCPIEC